MLRKCCSIICLFLASLLLASCSMLDSAHASNLPKPQWQLNDLLPASWNNNLWQAMRPHLTSGTDIEHARVKAQIRWFQQNKTYVNELTRNAKPYIYYIYQQTRKRHMPAVIALIPMIESNYNPFLYSRTGANGLWQMMPGTASGFGLKINWWFDGRRDVLASTKAALDYLAYLHDFFGNWLLAIAAYDAGEGTIQDAIRYNKRHHRATDYWALPLPAETKFYVPKLLALATIFRNPTAYGITLAPIPNHPFFKAKDLSHQIDLRNVAKLADTPLKTIRKLNAGFRRWTTIPKGTYTLLLPTQKFVLFNQRYQSNKLSNVTWVHYRVKPNDTLNRIAKHYHTSDSVIRRVNQLKNNTLQINQTLLIPQHDYSHYASRIALQHGSIAEDKLPGPQRYIHTVKRGETLWAIARDNHLDPRQIRFWNNLRPHSKLEPGQTLLLWIPKRKFFRTYEVYYARKGDNLSTIAERFGMSIKKIKNFNHLSTNLIRLGQKIKIPKRLYKTKHYTPQTKNEMIMHFVHPGESLESIAYYFQVSVKNIIHWNHLGKQRILRVGQPLRLYLSR